MKNLRENNKLTIKVFCIILVACMLIFFAVYKNFDSIKTNILNFNINGLEKNLHKVKPTNEESAEEKEANIVRLEAFKFSMCGLKEGAELEFINDSSKKCYVVSEKKVKYEEEEYSLSALAQKLLDKPYQVAGPHYFKYNGEILSDLRERLSNN